MQTQDLCNWSWPNSTSYFVQWLRQDMLELIEDSMNMTLHKLLKLQIFHDHLKILLQYEMDSRMKDNQFSKLSW